jgi:hypothetical protein
MPFESDHGDTPTVWNQYVAEEIIRSVTVHKASPGKHILRLFATEMGIVVEKIVIETLPGSLQQSYLGPPESVIV